MRPDVRTPKARVAHTRTSIIQINAVIMCVAVCLAGDDDE